MRKLVSGALPTAVVVCLLTLSGVLPAVAAAAAEAAPAAIDRAGQATLDEVCVERQGRIVLAATAPCGPGARRVDVGVADRLRVCVLADRVRAGGARACDRRGGETLLVPDNDRALFCDPARGNRLRGIVRPRQCHLGRVLVALNHRPGAPELSDDEIPENVPVGSAVGALTASDVDAGDRVAFSLVAGPGADDNALFAVEGSTLVTAAQVDFEARTSYVVRVRAQDLLGRSRATQLALTVVDAEENQAPTDVSLAPTSVAENQPPGTRVGRLSTSDPDDPFDADTEAYTYTLVTEAGVANENPLFEIVGDELRTTAVLDHEQRSRATVRVRTEDGAGGRFEKDIEIAVLDAADAPTRIELAPSTVAENVTGVVGRLSVQDQDAGDRHSFALVPGAGDGDNSAFAIAGDELSVVTPLDFEDRAAYTVRVRATDSSGLTSERSLTVRVTDADDPPTGIALTPASVEEDQPAGTLVGTLSVRDDDPGDSATFALVAGDGDRDNGSFTVRGDELLTATALDYESVPSLTVRVRATDGSGLSAEQALEVTVVNVNEAPTRLDLSGTSLAENRPAGTVVGTLSTDDPDLDDPVTYEVISGGGRFDVDGADLVTTAAFDFETASSHAVGIRATDDGGEQVEATFTIAVLDVNEAPTAPAINDDTVEENLPADTVVGRLSASDPDAGDSLTFALVPGAGDDDNDDFTISGGLLRTASTFDHEARDSYSVRVEVQDSGSPALSAASVLTIHVADVNEAPGKPSLSPATVPENAAPGTLVGTLAAVDPDEGATLAYAIDGPDASFFSVLDGKLYALDSFDFETRSSYEIQVEVSDGLGGTAQDVVEITVTDENDRPTSVSLSADRVDEDAAAGTVIGTLTTADQDAGDSHSYTLPAGLADNADFAVVGQELRTAAALDHETDPSLEVRVRSTDAAGAFVEATLTVTVDDVNEAPAPPTLTGGTIVENLAVQGAGTLAAVDPDGGPLTYELVSGAGDRDNDAFTISGSDLATTRAFDFEADGTASIRVRVSDSDGLSAAAALTITITDANDAPTGLQLADDTVAENLPAGTVVGTVVAVDQDAEDTFTYALLGPCDRRARCRAADASGRLTITPGGELRTARPLDHETEPELDARIRVTDGAGATYTETLRVTVTDVNEGPTRVELTPAEIDENQPADTAVGTLSAVDEDAEVDDPTFALVAGAGDTDNVRFRVDGDQLVARAPLDHETSGTYSIRVRATDAGGLSHADELTVTVRDINEAPSITGPAAYSVDENQPSGTAVATLAGTDPESDSLVWSLVGGAGSDDNASFSLTTGGELRTEAAFDFEAEDTYSVRVQASDGTLADERVLTVSVTDVNDAPTVVADSYNGVVGNTAATVGSATEAGPSTALSGSLPLANDTDQDGDPITAVAETVSTTQGGSLTIATDGSFSYRPGAGDKSITDTATYQVTDGTATSSGTISLAIGSRLVWYAGEDGQTGTGTSSSPFASIASVNSASGAGDEIYVYGGARQPTWSVLTMKADQKLVGAGVALTGILPAGTRPSITNGRLELASGVSVDGLAINATSDLDTVTATGVESFVVGSDAQITNTGFGVPLSVTGVASGDIDVAARIEARGGGPVRLSGRRGGTVSITGPISTTTASARAISLSGNTGSTIRFTGQLTLATGVNPAFSATGGGVLEVTGEDNTITTSAGTPLSVSGTTIGAAGLRFASITSGAATNAVSLSNTGSAGGLSVGSLTATGTTGPAVLLSGTHAPDLGQVTITGSGDDGVRASAVTGGLTVEVREISAAGNAAEENAIDLSNVTGPISIGAGDSGTRAISSPGDSGVVLENSAGNAGLTVAGITISGAGSGTEPASSDGIRVISSGSASVAVSVTGSTLRANSGDHVQVVSSGSGSISSARVAGNTMEKGSGANRRAVAVSAAGSPWAGDLAFDVADNIISGSTVNAVVVSMNNGPGREAQGYLRRNTIGTSGVPGSCSAQRSGIQVSGQDSGTLTVQISGNTVRGCAADGISLDAGAGASANLTVTSNDVIAQGGPDAWALFADLGLDPSDTGPFCLSASGNTLLGAAALPEDAYVRHRYGVLRVPQATGPDAVAVGGGLTSANAATFTASTPAATGSYLNGGSCPVPTS